MINCIISGKVVNIVESKDKLTKAVNIACYERSDYTVSVLKCPFNIADDFPIGSIVEFSVVPRAFYSNGKAKVLYYYKP